MGLKPDQFDAKLRQYLTPAQHASERGYTAVFLTVTVLATIGAIVAALLVRRPTAETPADVATIAPEPALCAA